MSRFVTALRVELQGDRKTWKLLSEFVYEDAEHGRIAVARGFETDFASVPRLPIVFDLVGAMATLPPPCTTGSTPAAWCRARVLTGSSAKPCAPRVLPAGGPG